MFRLHRRQNACYLDQVIAEQAKLVIIVRSCIMAAKPTPTAPAAEEIVNPADASPELSATAASTPAADGATATDAAPDAKIRKPRSKSPWKGEIPAGIEPERNRKVSASATHDVITFPVYVPEQNRTIIVEINTTDAETFLNAFDAVLDGGTDTNADANK